MNKLNQYDLQWCVRRLPASVRTLMKTEEITVGGGFIRSCIFREKPNDVDLFVPVRSHALEHAVSLAKSTAQIIKSKNLVKSTAQIIKSKNAVTVLGLKTPVQFITRWIYDKPEAIISFFDFTVCGAVFWWDHYCGKWCSRCSAAFYPDLAAKRIVYTKPDRNEDAGGSLLRFLKYYQKGFRAPISSLADVISRLMSGVRLSGGCLYDEHGLIDQSALSFIIKGLLAEVDPDIDPDHIIED